MEANQMKECSLCDKQFDSFSQLYGHRCNQERNMEGSLLLSALEIMFLNTCSIQFSCVECPATDLISLSMTCFRLFGISKKFMTQPYWERQCQRICNARFTYESVWLHQDGISSGGDWYRAYREEMRALYQLFNPYFVSSRMYREFRNLTDIVNRSGLKEVDFYVKEWSFSHYRTMYQVKRLSRTGTIVFFENGTVEWNESYSFGQKYRWHRYDMTATGLWSMDVDLQAIRFDMDYIMDHTEPKKEKSTGTFSTIIPASQFRSSSITFGEDLSMNYIGAKSKSK